MAAPIRTREEWEARAIEIAEAKHTIGTPHYHRACEHGHVWRVPSRSGKGSYDVLARSDGSIECPCTAARYSRLCAHVGAVLVAERIRAKAIAQPADDFSSWRLGFDW